MAQISPWSVKGVSPEDREAAKRAARQAGLPVGAWLSQTIRHAGHEPGGGMAAATPALDSDQAAEIQGLRTEVATLAGRLEALREALTRLQADVAGLAENRASSVASAGPPGEMPPEALASQVALERAVLRLSERLRTLEEAAEAARAGTSAGFWRRLFGRG